jgi:hypothetical protein
VNTNYWAYLLDATQRYKYGLNLASLLRVVVNFYMVHQVNNRTNYLSNKHLKDCSAAIKYTTLIEMILTYAKKVNASDAG